MRAFWRIVRNAPERFQSFQGHSHRSSQSRQPSTLHPRTPVKEVAVRTRVLLTMLQLGLFASPLLAQAEAKRPTAQQEKEIRSVYQQLLTAMHSGTRLR
jgi:hypothetical protein